jgi:NAD(P)-dependent dehydrogenase (short-subunit alcohol dehydrogenase family)
MAALLGNVKTGVYMSKVWFITGAGSGIGAATARATLKVGDRVVATSRNLDKNAML